MLYIWGSFWIVLALLFLAAKVKNTNAKVIISNLIAIPLAIFIGEAICGIINYEKSKDNNIGYIPGYYRSINYNKQTSYYKNKYIKKNGNKIIYNAVYTINNDGMRVTPSSNEKSDKCVMFFGCSFVFGIGLNDNETLPDLLGVKAQGKYKIYNFGFAGYGPHQMLYEVEKGFADNVIKGCNETTAIYTGIDDHILRVAGRKNWEAQDPEYSQVDNEVVYQGSFTDNKKSLYSKIEPLFKESEIYKYLNNYIDQQKSNLSEDEKEKYENLYIAILKKSKNLLRKKYNTKNFIVIFWNDDKNSKVIKKLKNNSFEYYLQSDILPNYNNNWQRYKINGDVHPNKLANEKIANFLAKRLNKKD